MDTRLWKTVLGFILLQAPRAKLSKIRFLADVVSGLKRVFQGIGFGGKISKIYSILSVMRGFYCLYHMFRTLNDLILQALVQRSKIRAVTRNLDHQPPVLFRFKLCFA